MIAPDRIERQLALARQGLTPSSQLRVLVRARFGASEPAPPAALTPAAGSALRARWRALRASGNLGVAVGVGLFGLGCAVGLLGSEFVLQRREAPISARPHADALAPPSLPPIAAAPSLVSEPAPLASAELPAAPAPAAPALAAPPLSAAKARERAPAADAARGRSAPRPARPAVPTRDWRGELELLERAERAIRADNVALALALLGDFDARYPESRLVEERAAVETMAHCQARATDGAARAERFSRLYPTSLYRPRVEALCPPGAPASDRSSDNEASPGH